MTNVLDLMDEEIAKADAPRSTGKPIFLYLQPDQKFLIRPLFDLVDAVPLMKHNLWNDDPKKRINAICAKEEGKECLYCQQASENKELVARLHFYLPIFVYKGVNQKTQEEVTFEETQEDGSKQTKPVKGFRVLELERRGSIGDVLKWIREFVRDEEDNCKITECDFSYSQSGVGKKKSLLIQNKSPKPMSRELAEKAKTIDSETVRTRVLEARPPFIVDIPAKGKAKDTDPEIEAVKVDEEPLDDTIMDF
jgi:hypothetical protein